MKEARFYSKGEKGLVYCSLCPHYCRIPSQGVGKCRARKNIDGTLHTMNYGRLTSYAFDPIEKKPLYHYYPGSRIFSIGTFGCNLDCDFCQNWEIVHNDNLYLEVSNKDILTLAKAQDSIGIAFTYNEPTIYFEFIYDLANITKAEGMRNVLVTNGYINQEPLKELLPMIDALNIDLKSIEDSFYKSTCKGRLSPVLETIETSYRHAHIEITTMVIDDKNSSFEEIDRLAKWLANIDKRIPLHLNRYFPNYRMKIPPTRVETLIEARNIAKKYLDYVYIGNLWGIDNNTYCPKCNTLLVDRHNGGMVLNMKDNICNKCGEIINLKY